MRNLFIVGLKLLGVLCFYWLFSTIGQLGIAFTSMRPFSSPGANSPWYFISFSGYLLLIQLIFGWLFLFRSEAIASALRMTDTDASVQIAAPSLLFAALIGVGVFILLESTPKLLQEFFYILQAYQSGRNPNDFQVSALIATVVQMVLAFIVIGRAKTMAIKMVPLRN